MKFLIGVLVLLLATSAVAQGNGQASSSLTSFLATLNPIVLIAAGVILFFAQKLAKLIAIVLIVLGLILLIIPFL